MRVAALENHSIEQLPRPLHRHIIAACGEILEWSDYSANFRSIFCMEAGARPRT